MSTEENKAIARRWFESHNARDFDAWDEIYAAEFVLHQSPYPDTTELEALKQTEIANTSAFPDLSLAVEDIIAEGDKVVVRFTLSGTHKAEWGDIPPTGKHCSSTGMMIFRFVGGRIVEEWVNADFLGLFQQLGFEMVPSKGEGEE